MLNQQTIEKLYAMRMRGMADGFIGWPRAAANVIPETILNRAGIARRN
jgi:hypothetical protein